MGNDLESLILANPLDDNLRVQLEETMRVTDPNGVQLELLCRERRIADTLECSQSVEDLIDEYIQFRIAHSNYFWDMRGCLNH